MLSVAVALIGGGGGRRMHILEDFIKQLIDKERWKVLQRYIFWSMGRFNEKTESHPYIQKCFFSLRDLIYQRVFFSERPWQGQHYQFVWYYIFWKSIISIWELWTVCLYFVSSITRYVGPPWLSSMYLSYFRIIDLSCRLPHLSGPASKEPV